MEKKNSIGQRAFRAVEKRADENGTSVLIEMAILGAERTSYRAWEKGEGNPSAYYLRQLALRGYDVMWILLGDEYGKAIRD